jgi:predicted enzyme involved in methoxymalonyl-ACP biosynthesis
VADALVIESWVMSCRVFARGAEHFVMAGLMEEARRRGALRLIGRYVPTGRNTVVRDLYPRLGFAPTETPERWELRLADAQTGSLWSHHIEAAP